MFLTEPHITLPNLFKDSATFNTLTNLQINFIKLKTLNISLQKEALAQCKTNFPFRWNRDSITYLAIQLTSQFSELYNKNYLPIL